VIVCERVFGVDHPDTIIAYVSQQSLKLFPEFFTFFFIIWYTFITEV